MTPQEYERVKQAFIKADDLAQQGDAQASEDARYFAQILRSQKPQEQSKPDERSFGKNALIGAGKFFTDTGLAARQIGADAGEFAAGTVAGAFPESEIGQRAYDMARSFAQDQESLAREAKEKQRIDAPIMRTGGGMVGNVGASILSTLPLLPVKALQTAKGAVALGGGLGALQPVAEPGERLKNVGIGSAGGGAGYGAVKGLSRALSPQTSKDALKLMGEGVELTPGQVLGGAFKSVEEKARSVPAVGDMIRRAQHRGIESFNKAALNKAVAPLGKKITKIGTEGLEEADDLISKQFDRVLGSIDDVKIDQTMAQSLDDIATKAARGLPDDQAKYVANVIDDEVLQHFTTGKMSGRAFKDVDTMLRQEASGLIKSPNPYDKKAGAAIKKVQDSLLDMLERQNPGKKGELTSVKRAYANLMNMEKAATTAGAETFGGVVTPAQLSQAIKTGSNIRAFRRGNLPLQDISRPAKRVMTSTIPDSGTAERLMQGAGLAGLYATSGLPGVAGLGVSSLLYTRPAINAINTMLTRRPEALRTLGTGLSRMGAVPGATFGASQASQ